MLCSLPLSMVKTSFSGVAAFEIFISESVTHSAQFRGPHTVVPLIPVQSCSSALYVAHALLAFES